MLWTGHTSAQLNQGADCHIDPFAIDLLKSVRQIATHHVLVVVNK